MKDVRYISRANPRDNTRHVILSTTSVRPTDFAAQLNVSLTNGWGIVRTVTDLLMKQPEGKYVLVKDPNKVSSYGLFTFIISTARLIRVVQYLPCLGGDSQRLRNILIAVSSCPIYG